MVGGPGAGKTNVGKGLQLGRRGYKVVNQDIALEAMKAEAGLPAKESDYTAEQRSTRSKLGAAARKAAIAKFDKYAANGDGMVIDPTEEKLRDQFADVDVLHVPMHSVLRVEEVSRKGQAVIRDRESGEKVTPFPVSPPGRSGN